MPDRTSSRLTRREFTFALAGTLGYGLASHASAAVPARYDWDAFPPVDSRANFVAWMVKNRGEDPGFLGQRYDRYLALLANHDIWEKRNIRAYLLTPRENFVTKANLDRAYQVHYLDIGFGVTITGPHSVARMTNSLDIQKGEKVLEIGTGSGYQSAYLSNLTDRVCSIEIIKPLAARTRALYDDLISRGYSEFGVIKTRQADGYYGWPEEAPFDKIIVTCGIDHVPPPLLQQLRPGGMMVIPVGPPGAQHILRITKEVRPDNTIAVSRFDIYGGATLSFVPFTKLEGDVVKGTHNQ